MEEWEKWVKKNQDHSEIAEWAYPLSEGRYTPTPLISYQMCMACETDSILERLPGTEFALFPEDTFSFMAYGTDDYILGWIQYLHYRFVNVMGWTTYEEPLTGRLYVDIGRLIRMPSGSTSAAIDQVKRSNPTGVSLVIQTDTEDSLETLSLPCLKIGGDLLFVTVLPIEEEKIKPIVSCFREIKVIRPGWSTPVMLPLVVVCCLNYNGNPPQKKQKKLPKDYQESVDEVIELMISQQEYLASYIEEKDKSFLQTTAPTFVQFLTDGFPAWNI